MGDATSAPAAGGAQLGPWAEFRRTPLRAQAYVALAVIAAIGLAALTTAPLDSRPPQWLTALMLLLVSVLNIELGRTLTEGISTVNQPHKALSAWAFASALLLPPPWLLLIVPLTYLHARWRGIRVTAWKWVGSAAFLILAGVAAAQVRKAMVGTQANWMEGDGGRGLLTMLVALAVFLVVEVVLFAIIANVNYREDEAWLRRTLTSWSFYGTEGGVLLIGGLLSAVWTGGPWYALVFLPVYALAQRAALHEPLRERADTAAALASKNDELEQANQFKIDLIGMLGHEIGNPLTAIHGFATLGAEALEAGNPEQAREALAVVERNAIQMRGVVLDILGLVTSERGRLTAVQEPCPLRPRLEAAADACPPDRRPVVDCPPELVAHVQSSHLDQILSNLLGNAEKYAGGATRLVARESEPNHVEVAVIDGGPGVAEAFRGRLFDRFSRHDGTAGLIHGTGLGLFICRELARANGGDVVHRDGDPSGAVFELRLERAG